MRLLEKIYVIDTHALVSFIKGGGKLGVKARRVMQSGNSRLVVPAYVFEELKREWRTLANTKMRMRVPPGVSLRLISCSTNMKVFPTSPAVIAEQVRLQRSALLRKGAIFPDEQDLLICATAVAIGAALCSNASVYIISNDWKIRKWGKVPLIWD